VPLAAVLRGIDTAFEKWRGRKVERPQMVNSLTYCAQAVLTEAQIMAGSGQNCAPGRGCPAFSGIRSADYLAANAELARKAGFAEIGASLENLAAETGRHYQDLEQLEQRLTALEEKLIANVEKYAERGAIVRGAARAGRAASSVPREMSAEQLSMLERQYLDRRLLEESGLPR